MKQMFLVAFLLLALLAGCSTPGSESDKHKVDSRSSEQVV